MAADTSLLSRKTARSPEGNVDVEPPSSMDDSSMILIEIGVDVDEGPHPNMTIGGRALIRLQRIYNFLLFHAIILPLLDVYGLYFTHLYHFWD